MFFRKNEEVILTVIENLIDIRIRVGKYASYIMRCVIQNDDTILIGDISSDYGRTGKYENKGYGSKLMQRLIDHATENDYKEIYGNLADVDMEHRDRLEHFYKKFGFEIIENSDDDNLSWGKVRKRL